MDISSILTNANIRPSYQRVTILKALSMCKTHPTAEELFERLHAVFDEETIVVMTTMAVFMIANNVFNDALQVEPEP